MNPLGKRVADQAAAIAAARAIGDVPYKPATTPQEHMGLVFLPGDRVLDRVTGQEGQVIGGNLKHTVIPTA